MEIYKSQKTPAQKRVETIYKKYGGFQAIGKKAAQTNKLRHGEDFYERQGAKGGKNGTTGGFGHPLYGRELARTAGAKGGRISRRRKSD